MSHASRSLRRHLQDALIVIRAIEEAIELNDPYNNLEYSEDCIPTLSDCDIPDHIEDPFALIRAVLGDEHAERVEYQGDLQLIACTLQRCIESKLGKHPRSIADFEAEWSGSEDEAVADAPGGAAALA